MYALALRFLRLISFLRVPKQANQVNIRLGGCINLGTGYLLKTIPQTPFVYCTMMCTYTACGI